MFLLVSVAVTCSVCWRAYSSFHIVESMWPFIDVGSIYNKYESVVLAISIFIGLFVTVRNIRKSGLKTKWTILFGSITLVGITIIIAHIVTVRILTNQYNATPFSEKNLTVLGKIVNDTSKSLTERSEISKIISSGKFILNGEITKYLDQNGTPKNYNPTADDRIIRDGRQRLKVIIIPSFKKYTWAWLIFLIVSLAAGLSAPTKREIA